MSLMTCEGGRELNIFLIGLSSVFIYPVVQCVARVQSIYIREQGRIAVTWPVFNSAGKTSKGKGQVAILKVASLHLPLKGIRSFQILKQNIPNISSAEC